MINSPELEDVVKELTKTKRRQKMYADDPVGFISRRCCEQVESLFWQYWLIKAQCISKADRQKKMSEFDSNKVSDLENINRYASLPDYETELEEFYAIKSSIEVLLATLEDVSNYQSRE
jgi:hypothetical protein